MKKREIIILLICWCFVTTVNAQNKWFTVAKGEVGGGSNPATSFSVSFKLPFIGNYDCGVNKDKCYGSFVNTTFEAAALSDTKLDGFYVHFNGYCKLSFPSNCYATYHFENIYVDASGFQGTNSGSFPYSCYDYLTGTNYSGTLYANGLYMKPKFTYYPQLSISVSQNNSPTSPMSVNIPNLATYLSYNLNNIYFQVARVKEENGKPGNWENRSFSILNISDLSNTTISYSDIMGNHTDWDGVELKIRIGQKFCNSNFINEDFKPFFFFRDVKIDEPITSPDCPGTTDVGEGRVTFNLLEGYQEKDASNNSYYPISVFLYKQGDCSDSDTKFKDANGNVIFCAKQVDGYQFTDSPTSPRFISPSVIKAGTYYMQLNNGRTSFPVYRIIEIKNNDLSVSATAQDIGKGYHLSSCNPNGSALVSLSGSSSFSSFQYSINGSISNNPISLTAGSYTISAIDNYGCKATYPFEVKAAPEFSVSVSSKSDVICNGDSSGIITTTLTGGVSDYVYSITKDGEPYIGNIAGNTISNLAKGRYNVNVTDGTACTRYTGYVDINEPAPLVLNAVPKMPECFNGEDGSITFTPSGGHPNYKVTIKNSSGITVQTLLDKQEGVSFTSAANLRGGDTYKVYITDNGEQCSNNGEFSILNPNQLLIQNFIQSKPASCYAVANGEATFTVANLQGTPRFLYSGGAEVQNIIKVSENNYRWSGLGTNQSREIRVQDGNCYSAFSSVNINPKSSAISITTQGSYADCKDTINGKISVTVSNGESVATGFKYTIKDEDGIETSIIKNNETHLFTGIDGDKVYSIKATDGLGCSTDFVDIKVGLDPYRLQLNPLGISNAKCEDNPTGEISVSRIAGTGYNSITYSLVGENPEGQGDDDLYTFKKLLPDKPYTIQVKDSKCTIETSAIIPANPNPVSITFSDIKQQSCKEVPNGTLRVTASSKGPGGIDYGIKFIANRSLSDTIKSNTKYYEEKDSFYYAFKAVDNNNCFAEASYNLVNLKNNPHLVVLGYDSVACQNDHTGTIRLGVKQKNRQPSYQFYRNGVLNTTDSTFNNLESQSEKYRIVDNESCPGDTVLSVPIIASSVKFASNPGIENASCFNAANGKITATAVNGIPFSGGKYRYEINTGEVIDGISAVFDGLEANTDYIITATDSRNCVRSTAKIPVRVMDDSLQLRTPAPINATCAEKSTGKVLVTKVNGDPFKSGFLFNVKDSVGTIIRTNKLPGADTTITLSGFPRGKYSVSVTDSNSCSVSKPFVIGYNALFSSNGSVVSKVSRFGKPEGQVRSTINDGNGRFVYQLYKSEDLANAVRSDTVKNSILQINQLYAGSYVLKVKDTANCKYDDDEWMEDDIFIQQPKKALALSVASQTNVFCFGDSTASVKLQPEGGYREYQYSINDTNTFKRDSTFNKLKSGIYKLYVRDSARVDTFIYVTVTQPSRALSPANANVKFATCYGYTDGFAVVNAVGGTPPYRLSIDSARWSSSGKITDLAAGVYRVIIKDTLNCVAYLNDVIVDQPDPMSVKKYTITNTPCLKSEGKIDITQVNGGNGEYTYSWTKDNSLLGDQPFLSSLRSGAYQLSLIDGMGCLGDTSFFVADLSDIRVNFTTTPVSCWGRADGKAEMIVLRGATPFKEVQWPGVPSGLYATTALDSGLYRVVMEDNLGCRRDTFFRVSSLSEIQIPERWITDPLCLGNNNGEITVNASGGNGGYRYDWGTTGTGSNIDHLSPGTYTVSVTDANNCVKSFEFNLAYAKLEKPNLGRDMQLCSKSDYILNPAGYANYDWRLNNRKISSEPSIIVKEPGDYAVNVVSDEGCIGSDTVTIAYGADEMLADFLLTSKAYAGDTIMLVEISRPLPDSVNWYLPSNAKLLDYGKYYKQIALTDTGTYEFSMVSYYKGCADMVQKYVQVVPADPASNKKSAKSDLIQYVSLYPNPNNGRFDLDIRLSGKSEVFMRLVNLGSGTIESSRIAKGSDMYTEHFDLRLSPGMYTLHIQAGKESRTVNIVVL